MLCKMPFDDVEGRIADIVFDFAGIFGGGFRVHTQTQQHLRKNRMPLVDFGGNLLAFPGQAEEAMFVYLDISAFTQSFHGTADAWL